MVREHLEDAQRLQMQWEDYVLNHSADLGDHLSTVAFDSSENRGLLEADRAHTILALQKLALPDGVLHALPLEVDGLFQQLFTKEAPVIIERIRKERRESKGKLTDLLRRRKQT